MDPPGTGKTLLPSCRHHTEMLFLFEYQVNSFRNILESSRMVRELLFVGQEHAPTIAFHGRLETIGGTRLDRQKGGGDSEVQNNARVANQHDGFEPRQNIKVLMATS